MLKWSLDEYMKHKGDVIVYSRSNKEISMDRNETSDSNKPVIGLGLVIPFI